MHRVIHKQRSIERVRNAEPEFYKEHKKRLNEIITEIHKTLDAFYKRGEDPVQYREKTHHEEGIKEISENLTSSGRRHEYLPANSGQTPSQVPWTCPLAGEFPADRYRRYLGHCQRCCWGFNGCCRYSPGCADLWTDEHLPEHGKTGGRDRCAGPGKPVHWAPEHIQAAIDHERNQEEVQEHDDP